MWVRGGGDVLGVKPNDLNTRVQSSDAKPVVDCVSTVHKSTPLHLQTKTEEHSSTFL